MKKHPILFSGDMVRAILDGRKTQTRRVIKRLSSVGEISEFGHSPTIGYDFDFRGKHKLWNSMSLESVLDRCPYGQPGDLLWVKQTWRRSTPNLPDGIQYRANNLLIYFDNSNKGRAAREWANEKSIPRDGVWRSPRFMPKICANIWLRVKDIRVERVQDIVGSHHNFGWDVNPHVWVVEFEVVK